MENERKQVSLEKKRRSVAMVVGTPPFDSIIPITICTAAAIVAQFVLHSGFFAGIMTCVAVREASLLFEYVKGRARVSRGSR